MRSNVHGVHSCFLLFNGFPYLIKRLSVFESAARIALNLLAKAMPEMTFHVIDPGYI
jgi:hypothetical protein